MLTGKTSGSFVEQAARALAADTRRGAFVLYPTYPFERDEPDWPEIPVMGFATPAA